jgi:hypothetical protein
MRQLTGPRPESVTHTPATQSKNDPQTHLPLNQILPHSVQTPRGHPSPTPVDDNHGYHSHAKTHTTQKWNNPLQPEINTKSLEYQANDELCKANKTALERYLAYMEKTYNTSLELPHNSSHNLRFCQTRRRSIHLIVSKLVIPPSIHICSQSPRGGPEHSLGDVGTAWCMRSQLARLSGAAEQ